MALLGSLQELKTQVGDNVLLQKGIDYLLSFDVEKEFAGVSPGNNRKVKIDGDNVVAIIQEYEPKQWDEIKFEGHQKFIDIQCVFGGEEKLLHANVDKVTEFNEYNEEKDIHFSPVSHYSTFLLTPGDASVLFPCDMHAPCMFSGFPGIIRKVVIKVKAQA